MRALIPTAAIVFLLDQASKWGVVQGLNLIERGANYGWPVVSEGDHYDGREIPPHSTRPEFAAPAISWNPVIASCGLNHLRAMNLHNSLNSHLNKNLSKFSSA